MALVPYADDDPADERVRAVLARLPEPRINLFAMLANAPALIGPTLRLGEAILTDGDLLKDEAPPPEVVTAAESELGRAQLIELLIVTGYYAMLGGVMRAVRLDVDNVVEKGMLDREQLIGKRRTTD